MLIAADWPAPEGIRAYTTTRNGGNSLPPYDSFNLAHHVGDDPNTVDQNRLLLETHAHLPASPVWLNQIHSTLVCHADEVTAQTQADASFTDKANQVCVVMTADCLPILLCNPQEHEVAAIHAGWRGLAGGIIAQTLEKLTKPYANIMAWLGPAIGPAAFEVGNDVYDAFIQQDPSYKKAFQHDTLTSDKMTADLYELARLQLRQHKINAIYGGNFCTYTDHQDFFSYRREQQTGRMASFIWLTA